MNFWDKKEVKNLLQKPFNKAFIGKPRIKHLKSIDLLHELPFYCKNIRSI